MCKTLSEHLLSVYYNILLLGYLVRNASFSIIMGGNISCIFNNNNQFSSKAEAGALTNFEVLVKLQFGLVWRRARNTNTRQIDFITLTIYVTTLTSPCTKSTNSANSSCWIASSIKYFDAPKNGVC